jgi:methionine-rich copper-binding protein CopC
MRRRRSCAAGIAALTLAGCAGNGEGLDANGRPLGSGGPGGPLVATFDSIQANVFTPICTACHAGGAAPEGLRLDAGSSYDLLVGVPSNEVSSLQRVTPGDPDRSYLVQKLEGNAAVGARMPLGGPYLDQATIDVIRQWISDGAARTSAAATSAPLALATASPANGATVTDAPAHLVLAFTRELDTTRLDASSVHLDRLEDDSGTTTSVAIAARAVDANPRAVVVTPRASLAPGRYVLQVDAEALADLQGRPLGSAAPSGVRVVFAVEGQT